MVKFIGVVLVIYGVAGVVGTFIVYGVLRKPGCTRNQQEQVAVAYPEPGGGLLWFDSPRLCVDRAGADVPVNRFDPGWGIDP